VFSHLVQNIEPLIREYGALGVFGASIVEEIIAPIPSTIVVFTSGILLTHGQTGWTALSTILFQIMLPASAGITIGSLFPYFLARIGEKVAIERFGKTLGVNWATIEKARAWYEKRSSYPVSIFVTRAIPGIPSLAVSILSGLARVPVGTYLLWSFLGCLPRNFILGVLGWVGGAQYMQHAEKLSSLETVVLVGVVIAGVVGFLYWRRKRKGVIAGKGKGW